MKEALQLFLGGVLALGLGFLVWLAERLNIVGPPETMEPVFGFLGFLWFFLWAWAGIQFIWNL